MATSVSPYQLRRASLVSPVITQYRSTKTLSSFEYKDDKGRWRRYTPDFVIRRRDGKTLIVEIKREHDRGHPVDGETGRKALALRKWEDLDPKRVRYEMLFTDSESVTYDQLSFARAFVRDEDNA